MNLERVNVCGTSSSGKSTLAKRLADLYGAQYVELDALWHRPNWETAPQDEFRAAIQEALSGTRWVVDGTYSKVRDITWARVQTVIWLDYPLPILLWRSARRSFGRAWRREELWNTGNRERLWRHLFVPKDSLFWWILATYRKVRRSGSELRRDPQFAHIEFLHFTHPSQAEKWLRSLELQPPA